jgi:hypothetical protein
MAEYTSAQQNLNNDLPRWLLGLFSWIHDIHHFLFLVCFTFFLLLQYGWNETSSWWELPTGCLLTSNFCRHFLCSSFGDDAQSVAIAEIKANALTFTPIAHSTRQSVYKLWRMYLRSDDEEERKNKPWSYYLIYNYSMSDAFHLVCTN